MHKKQTNKHSQLATQHATDGKRGETCNRNQERENM